jgi:hypothetical protein
VGGQPLPAHFSLSLVFGVIEIFFGQQHHLAPGGKRCLHINDSGEIEKDWSHVVIGDLLMFCLCDQRGAARFSDGGRRERLPRSTATHRPVHRIHHYPDTARRFCRLLGSDSLLHYQVMRGDSFRSGSLFLNSEFYVRSGIASTLRSPGNRCI